MEQKPHLKESESPVETPASVPALIAEFLRQKRIAVVGVSRKPQHFSREVLRQLLKRKYDVVPVNRHAADLDGIPTASAVGDIVPPPDGVIVMTPAFESASVVHECIEAGIGRIWLFRTFGSGSVSREAVEMCKQHSVKLIEGFCPLMFLADTGLIHRCHRFLMKLTGSLPN